jgi:hypothetical protein
MPLTGLAKIEYQRAYMRKRRAAARAKAKPKAKVKREREPHWAALYDLGRWLRHPRYCPQWGEKVIAAGIDLETEQGKRDAYRRFLDARREHRAELKAERDADAKRKAEQAAEMEVWRRSCDWCRQPSSDDRRVITNGTHRICIPCAHAVIRCAETGIEPDLCPDSG